MNGTSNNSGNGAGGIGSSPIGRSSSPAPPPSAGLPNKPSSATTRYSLGASTTSPGSGGGGSGGTGLGNKNSMSALRSPNLNTNIGLAAAAGGGGSSPGGNNPGAGGTRLGGLRPSSEMLSGYPQSASYLSPNALASAQFASAAASGLAGGMGAGAASAGLMKGTPEADAIDKWFEDLQHYEATLEEMAAASLDQNFKEELSAIEQWFRVLSEAERTAALYSLLQESTQVQIRFFITVLQQMARNDPISALLSPGAGHNSLMAEQMETKLASLGLKSPSAMKSPNAAGGFRPQSDVASAFLSPNAAANQHANDSNAANLLAAQRAKLKGNRTSAPGHLAAIGGDRSNFAGLTLDQVQEGGRPVSPGLPSSGLGGQGQMANVRPKSTDGLTAARATAAGNSPRPNGPLDDALSPLSAQGPGGSWASMMNTPLMPMFNDDAKGQQDGTGQTLDAATLALNNVKLTDDNLKKFNNRKSGQTGVPNSFNLGGNSNLAGIQGVLSGMYDQNGNNLQSQAAAQMPNVSNVSAAQLSAALAATTGGLSPNMGAAQWVNQQNDFLRSPLASAALALSPNALAGLQSPSGGLANPVNMQIMNTMAAMGGMQNMSAAQFLALQQQILQQQAASTGQFAGLPMSAGLAGGFGGNQQFGAGGGLRSAGVGRNAFGGPGLSVGLGNTRDKPQRSPRLPGSNLPQSARSATFAASGSGGGAGGAGGEEEIADISVLNDTAAWLRHLRLHKYTTNFENDHWKDMVLMDEKALEAKGVAALGARRKMLKTFELVRAKYGIKMPGEEEGKKAEGEEAVSGEKASEATNGSATEGEGK